MGCTDCINAICDCKNVSSSSNYIECENMVTADYVKCAEKCDVNDFECSTLCNRYYNESLKQCPCQEDCPDGCPCSGYECSDITTTTSNPSTTTTAVTTSSTSAIKETTSSAPGPPTSVLVLYADPGHPEKRPLITDVMGRQEYNIWFKFDQDTSVLHSCSLVFQNQMIVFGGSKDASDQISIVDQCQLKRIGSLPIPFEHGACTVAHYGNNC